MRVLAFSAFAAIVAIAPSVAAVESDVAPPVEANRLSYWDQGEPRPFVSARVDVGPNYAKPLVAIGYGKPHWMWIGIEAFPITTTEFGAFYGGIRGSLAFLDVAFGYRDNYSYTRGYLTPRDHHDLAEVRAAPGTTRYLTWELEVSGVVPLLGGFVVWAMNADRILDAPAGVHLYEESARAIAQPPWIIEARIGYVYPVLRDGSLKVGLLADEVFLPHRAGNVYRVGPGGALALTDHLELLGFVTVAVKSPDSLGLFLGAFGVGGLRYKFSTGDLAPKFP